MKGQEKYVVVLIPKDDDKARERIGVIKDWDGKSPLYYNGRYYNSYSGDVTKAKLYSAEKDALRRLDFIKDDIRNWYNRKICPFTLIMVKKLVFKPFFIGKDIMVDVQAILK